MWIGLWGSGGNGNRDVCIPESEDFKEMHSMPVVWRAGYRDMSGEVCQSRSGGTPLMCVCVSVHTCVLVNGWFSMLTVGHDTYNCLNIY